MTPNRMILPILAIIGFLLGLFVIYYSMRPVPTPPIEFPPPVPPFEHFIACSGIVEASSNNVNIGTSVTETITNVYVSDGDYVKKNDPLFTLDSRVVEKRLEEAEASLQVSVANYQRQMALPRQENIPPQVALVKQAKARFKDYLTRYEIVEKIDDPKAVSRDEFYQRKYGALIALYQLEEAQKNLDLLLAGAWIRDLEIYRAQLKEAESRVATIKAELEQYTIRAPFDGVAMQVNVRVGELAQSSNISLISPLIIFGVVDPLRIKVEVDEADIWRVIEGAPGCAYVRGNSTISTPIHFVSINPFLVPKTSLTGDNDERVDTRVLQIKYCLERNGLPIYPGQIMDVFLKAKPNLGVP